MSGSFHMSGIFILVVGAFAVAILVAIIVYMVAKDKE